MLHDLLTANSLRLYIGKALLLLALAGPAAYCTVEESRSDSASDIARTEALADLHALCIREHGDWNTRREECEFDD